MEKPGYPFGAAVRRAGVSALALGLVLLAAAVFGARSAYPAPPTITVSFKYDPSTPLANRPITFTSTSTVGGNNIIVSQLWDLNGDGVYGDAAGPAVTTAFAVGEHTVGLRVVDRHGEDHMHVVSQSITVLDAPPQNRGPLASFVYYPGSPLAGAPVHFYSTSTDPDSPIASQAWDLDGDGTFGDVVGPAVVRTFPIAGTYTVGLRVVDTAGAASRAATTVVVEDPTRAGLLETGTRGLRLLSPFPVVRLSGTLGARGVRVRRLTVSGPRGVSIRLLCRGRHCPFKTYRIRDSAAGKSDVVRDGRNVRVARVLRLRRLEGRLLRIGLRLQLYVTKPRMIGKYTRFRIRRGRPPARTDGCLVPGARAPVRCPSG